MLSLLLSFSCDTASPIPKEEPNDDTSVIIEEEEPLVTDDSGVEEPEVNEVYVSQKTSSEIALYEYDREQTLGNPLQDLLLITVGESQIIPFQSPWNFVIYHCLPSFQHHKPIPTSWVWNHFWKRPNREIIR